MANQEAEKSDDQAASLLVLGELEHGETQRFAGADGVAFLLGAELEAHGTEAGIIRTNGGGGLGNPEKYDATYARNEVLPLCELI